MRELREEIREERDARLRAEREEEEEDNVHDQMEQAPNSIGAILGHPVVVNLLTNIAANLFTPKINNMPTQPQVLHASGIDPVVTEEDQNLLFNLKKNGLTTEDLRLLANIPPDKIVSLRPLLQMYA